MRTVLAFLTLFLATACPVLAEEIRPFVQFNSNYEIWQRGSSFTISGNARTAAMVTSGSGGGGTVVVTRKEFPLHQNAVPGSPRYYLEYDWTTLPTAGENRVGFTEYFSFHDLRIEDGRRFAGEDVSVCAYMEAETPTPLYIHIVQGTGQTGNTGKGPLGTHISEAFGGIDYSPSVPIEILQLAPPVDVTPGGFKKYCAVFTLDGLGAASFSTDNVIVFGLGVAYDQIAAVGSNVINVSTMWLERGTDPQEPTVQNKAWQAETAKRYWEPFGLGVNCVAMSATNAKCHFRYSTDKKQSAFIEFINTTPRFRRITAGTTPLIENTSPTYSSVSYGQSAGMFTIAGFTGLTIGDEIWYEDTGDWFAIHFQ